MTAARLAPEALDRLLPLRSRTSSSKGRAYSSVYARVNPFSETFRDLASVARPRGTRRLRRPWPGVPIRDLSELGSRKGLSSLPTVPLGQRRVTIARPARVWPRFQVVATDPAHREKHPPLPGDAARRGRIGKSEAPGGVLDCTGLAVGPGSRFRDLVNRKIIRENHEARPEVPKDARGRTVRRPGRTGAYVQRRRPFVRVPYSGAYGARPLPTPL